MSKFICNCPDCISRTIPLLSPNPGQPARSWGQPSQSGGQFPTPLKRCKHIISTAAYLDASNPYLPAPNR